MKKGYIHQDTLCPTNSDDTVLSMPPPFLGGQALRGLRNVFTMYVKFPKNRWPEIRQAEEPTPEGDAIRDRLREEYIATFLNNPEGDIEKVNATA